ncbi:MAG: cytochrome c biogenesis protein CcdA [Myxococcota bacterium]
MKRLAALVLLAVVSLLPSAALAYDVGAALEGSVLLVVAFVFAQGLLTAFTPCVYPLIPITVSIFGAREGTRVHAALLSATYVLGIAATFSTLGVAVALTGGLFGRVMSNAWVLGFVAIVFAAFAASMLGAFDIRLPQGLNQRLSHVGGKGFLGALGMGLVAGLIAAPCAGPVVGGVLAYVGAKGSASLGFGLLFAYGVGMGLPFFLVGAFSMALPKSGPWLDSVKHVLGIALLANALYLLKDAVPPLKALLRPTPGFIAGAVLLVAVGLLLGAVHKRFDASVRERALKTAGVALVVLGLYGSVGAATLSRAETSTWTTHVDAALARGRTERKPVLIDFWADWCQACKELDAAIYPTALFKAEATRFVLAKADMTKDDDATEALAERYGINGLPAVVFVTSDGTVLREPRVLGLVPPERMVEAMRRVR